MNQKKVLGRGLGALIPQRGDSPPIPFREGLAQIPIGQILPNPYQPRKVFNEASIEELARSVREHGIVQPLVVSRAGDSRYRLIAGERRLRAAERAGLQTIPAVVKELTKEGDALQIALIENIQREDLNPIEEALAYRRLAEEFQLRQEDIAAAVGKDRASVANFVRLLRLPEEVRTEVASGRLSMGHARALLSLSDESDQRRIARDVIARNLSVRETESLVKKIVEDGAPLREAAASRPVDVHTRAAEDRLKLLLGTRVRIIRRGTRGRIEIDFGSEEELIRIYEQLTDR